MTINASVGLSKIQEVALDKHLSAGRASHNGMAINAMLTGLLETFQGCTTQNVIGADLFPAYARTIAAINTDSITLVGTRQYFKLDVADTATGATIGFPNAAAAGDTGVLRLANADQNGVLGCALHQGNALWIAPATSFKMTWDIATHTCIAGTANSLNSLEVGVAGTFVSTDFVVGANEFASDGASATYGSQFIAVKIVGGAAQLRVKANSDVAGTVTESATVQLPSTRFQMRVEYNYSAVGGYATLFINDQKQVTVQGSVTGPFQVAARICHNTGYLAASHAPASVDIDTIMVGINN